MSSLKIEFIVEQGEDNMKQEIESNYCQIKSEILHIVENEMERIKNDPELTAFDTAGIGSVLTVIKSYKPFFLCQCNGFGF